MSESNGMGVATPTAAAPSPPGLSSVEHWTFQADSPFRGPAEIRELAGRAAAAAADEAFGAGSGDSWPETEDPFFEALEQVEELEAYDEAETEGVEAAEAEAAAAEADLLEEAPAGEHPLAAVFSLPRLAFDAMAKGGWATAIAIGIGAGLRDVNKLTNMIFWFRHPQLIGQRIRADQRDLAREWTDIRDGIVKPALAGAAPSAPAVPSAPATPPAPRPLISGGRTSISPDGLRWYGPGEATPELMAFIRKVYDLHVKRSKGDFVDTLPDSAIEEVEPGSGKKARKDAARKAREMLAAARAAIAAEGLTGTVRIGILSAYRSADRQFDIWQGKTTKGTGGFPLYYEKTRATRRRANYGGEHSDKAAAYLAEYMGQCVAAPGYSNHQDGLALDLGTRKGRGNLIKLYEGSWFHNWMKANACKYQFVPLPSEAWHWTYRPAAGGSAGEAGEFESPAPWPSADVRASEVTPTVIKAGKLEVQRIPLLASHRGRAPDLILRWNDMPAVPAEIDVAVHLHGYSRATMTLPKHIEVWAGLDLAPVDGASGTGRSRPTLTVLPRGHFTGVQVGSIFKYTFPALTTKDGLTTLVRVALERFADLVGGLPPKVGRLILTAHSGGGAPLMQILRRHDPQEVHVYDGLYQDATALADWASRHIKADRLAVQAGADRTGAMRVFFRPGTRLFSLRVLKATAPHLQDAPASIRDRYQVESSTLGHWQIPRQYGWRILADAAADVPDARRPPAPKSPVKRPFEVGTSEVPFLPEAPFPHQAPDTAEVDEAEAWELGESDTEGEADEGEAWELGESDTEGEAELDELQSEALFDEPQAPAEFEDPEDEASVAGELEMLASEQSPSDLGSPEALDDSEDFESEMEFAAASGWPPAQPSAPGPRLSGVGEALPWSMSAEREVDVLEDELIPLTGGAPTAGPRPQLVPIAVGPTNSRRLFVVKSATFVGLPVQTRKALEDEIKRVYAFVGHKAGERPMRVKIVEWQQLPVGFNFSDSVVSLIDTMPGNHLDEVIRMQRRNAEHSLRRLGFNVEPELLGGHVPSVPERVGQAVMSKSSAKAGSRKLIIPIMASVVRLGEVISLTFDEFTTGRKASEIRRRRGSVLNSSRYWASASALVDAKVLAEIDTVKSNRSDPRKWPGTAQEMLGRALGRAMAHEARHLYIVGHADTGLGSDSPQFVEGMDSDFSSQDRRDILDAIRRLESTQGNATVVETFPRDRRAVGIPF